MTDRMRATFDVYGANAEELHQEAARTLHELDSGAIWRFELDVGSVCDMLTGRPAGGWVARVTAERHARRTASHPPQHGRRGARDRTSG